MKRSFTMKEYNRKKLYLKRALFYGMLLLLLVFTVDSAKKAYEGRRMQEDIAEKILRFHVRANSDSSFDQACKLKVRDAVISKVSQMMDKADTKEEAFDILKKQKDSIKNTAKEILKKEGVIQKVKVHFVQEKFPEKTYGQYTFPEGVYDALRIDLGEAKGHNWWCVMFPDLWVTKDDKVRINNTARKKMEKLLGKKVVEKITKDKYLGWLFKA